MAGNLRAFGRFFEGWDKCLAPTHGADPSLNGFGNERSGDKQRILGESPLGGQLRPLRCDRRVWVVEWKTVASTNDLLPETWSMSGATNFDTLHFDQEDRFR